MGDPEKEFLKFYEGLSENRKRFASAYRDAIGSKKSPNHIPFSLWDLFRGYYSPRNCDPDFNPAFRKACEVCGIDWEPDSVKEFLGLEHIYFTSVHHDAEGNPIPDKPMIGPPNGFPNWYEHEKAEFKKRQDFWAQFVDFHETFSGEIKEYPSFPYYMNGESKHPALGKDLRTTTRNGHGGFFIHKDDVAEFLRRVKEYKETQS